MRRSRNGPALFELLEESGGSILNSLSGKSRLIPRGERTAEALPPARHREPAKSEVQSDGTDVCGSWISLDGDRIRLSLSSLSAALVLFVLALSLLMAFGVGMRRGETRGLQRGLANRSAAAESAPDEVIAVREQAPASELIRDIAAGVQGPALQAHNHARDANAAGALKTPPPLPSQQEASETKWLKDRTYIVAQEMSASSMVSAEAARDFLARKGIQATIVKPNDRTLLLVTTRGYNHKDGAEKRQSEQLLDRIRALGTEFYAAGGGYKLEGYFRTLKRDAW